MGANLKKKICLIGAFAVGKTSLVRQYVDSLFSEKYHTTVGVKIDKKQLEIQDWILDLIIWDLHGEDDFQSVRMSYLRGASGCIYVADGTRRTTLDTALLLRQRVETAIGPTPGILAINKCDLETLWEVDPQDVAGCSASNFSILRTSAKTGQSVETVFATLAAMMLEVGQ
jgi:small GTP-binding protein